MIDMAWLSAIILGAGCLALGYIIGVRHSSRTSLSNKASGGTETLVDGKKKKGVKPPLEVERLAEILEDFKMVSSLLSPCLCLCQINLLRAKVCCMLED